MLTEFGSRAVSRARLDIRVAAPRQVSSVSLLQATKRGAAVATACSRGLTGLGFRCRVLDSTGDLTTTTDAVIACDATSARALSRLQPATPVMVALVRATGLDTVELLSEGS